MGPLHQAGIFSFSNLSLSDPSIFPCRPRTWTCAVGELLQGSRQAVPQSIPGEVRNLLNTCMGLVEIFLLSVVNSSSCS